MILHITTDQILAAGAQADCQVFADLRRVLGPDPWEIDWTRARQIELIRAGLGTWITHGWLSGILPLWSMAGADLSGANLEGVYLRGADLFGVNLTGANLRGAHLHGANLRCALVEGADFTGANLHAVEVCVCRQKSCLKTFRTLLSFGWSADDKGRLQRLSAPRIPVAPALEPACA